MAPEVKRQLQMAKAKQFLARYTTTTTGQSLTILMYDHSKARISYQIKRNKQRNIVECTVTFFSPFY